MEDVLIPENKLTSWDRDVSHRFDPGRFVNEIKGVPERFYH